MNRAQAERAMSVEQRKKIFALYRDCGIGKELRHDVQYGVAGKTSLTDFTSNDAARLIEHLERLPLTSPKAGAGVTHRAPAPNTGNHPPIAPINADSKKRKIPVSNPRKSVKSVDKIHKLPSPEQRVVLEHLYAFSGYTEESARRAFSRRIERHDRPLSMWDAEELIFALVAQAAPKMLATITAPGFSARLTPFEHAFMFTNCVKFDLRGNMIPGTFNAAKHELQEYIGRGNKRGRRTMPRFSLTKFFEIVGKYR